MMNSSFEMIRDTGGNARCYKTFRSSVVQGTALPFNSSFDELAVERTFWTLGVRRIARLSLGGFALPKDE
jgi:hypothetical protein